ALHQGTSMELVLVSDRGFEVTQEHGRFLDRDLFHILRQRIRLLVEPFALTGRVKGADDQAGDGVALVADAGDVPPRVGRVRSVHADGIAMTASLRLVRPLISVAPTWISQYQLVS